MRVVAGSLGGRQFASPRGHRTHPMSEKGRGALFNALGDITGLTVLDAFSGSGALSIEAISRGARSATAIELDKEAVRTISDNLRQLDIEDKVTLLRRNVKGWSRNNQQREFDIVLADPPYDDIRPDVLAGLTTHLTADAILVISWPGKEPPREFPGVTIISAKNYGDAQLVFYRRTK